MAKDILYDNSNGLSNEKNTRCQNELKYPDGSFMVFHALESFDCI